MLNVSCCFSLKLCKTDRTVIVCNIDWLGSWVKTATCAIETLVGVANGVHYKRLVQTTVVSLKGKLNHSAQPTEWGQVLKRGQVFS